MKKLTTIINEVPNTEAALRWYTKLCEKQIKENLENNKALETALAEANQRLKKIEEQKHEPTVELSDRAL